MPLSDLELQNNAYIDLNTNNQALYQIHRKKKMAAVHFTAIPCEPNYAHLACGTIWFNGSRSYTNIIALIEFE